MAFVNDGCTACHCRGIAFSWANNYLFTVVNFVIQLFLLVITPHYTVIYVTFTAIVPRVYPGEATMCQTDESGVSPPISHYLFITAGAIYTTGE